MAGVLRIRHYTALHQCTARPTFLIVIPRPQFPPFCLQWSNASLTSRVQSCATVKQPSDNSVCLHCDCPRPWTSATLNHRLERKFIYPTSDSSLTVLSQYDNWRLICNSYTVLSSDIANSSRKRKNSKNSNAPSYTWLFGWHSCF